MPAHAHARTARVRYIRMCNMVNHHTLSSGQNTERLLFESPNEYLFPMVSNCTESGAPLLVYYIIIFLQSLFRSGTVHLLWGQAPTLVAKLVSSVAVGPLCPQARDPVGFLLFPRVIGKPRGPRLLAMVRNPPPLLSDPVGRKPFQNSNREGGIYMYMCSIYMGEWEQAHLVVLEAQFFYTIGQVLNA